MTNRPQSTCTRLLRRLMASTQAGCSEESFGSRLWIASVSSGRRVILCRDNVIIIIIIVIVIIVSTRVILCRDYVRNKYIAFIIIVVVLIIMATTCMGSIRKECMARD